LRLDSAQSSRILKPIPLRSSSIKASQVTNLSPCICFSAISICSVYDEEWDSGIFTGKRRSFIFRNRNS